MAGGGERGWGGGWGVGGGGWRVEGLAREARRWGGGEVGWERGGGGGGEAVGKKCRAAANSLTLRRSKYNFAIRKSYLKVQNRVIFAPAAQIVTRRMSTMS